MSKESSPLSSSESSAYANSAWGFFLDRDFAARAGRFFGASSAPDASGMPAAPFSCACSCAGRGSGALCSGTRRGSACRGLSGRSCAARRSGLAEAAGGRVACRFILRLCSWVGDGLSATLLACGRRGARRLTDEIGTARVFSFSRRAEPGRGARIFFRKSVVLASWSTPCLASIQTLGDDLLYCRAASAGGRSAFVQRSETVYGKTPGLSGS